MIANTFKVNPESRTMLPKMAFTGFASRYREPGLNEGFQDIAKVDFQVRPLLIPGITVFGMLVASLFLFHGI